MRASRRGVLIATGAVIAALGVTWLAIGFVHYVPFTLASYAAWGGVFVACLGLLNVAKPLRRLGVRRRWHAAIVVALGAVVSATAVLWPAPRARVAGSHQRLDDFLPECEFREYHEALAHAPVERVIEASRRVSLADMPAAVALMRLRGLAGGQLDGVPVDPQPLLDLMNRPGSGFLRLDDSDSREIVVGLAGSPWTDEPPPRVSTPEDFLEFRAPGQIRAAFNIRVVEQGPGLVLVSTETRTLGNDAAASRAFARYWRIIYPGSSIIRRVWLDAIVARAERAAGPGPRR